MSATVPLRRRPSARVLAWVSRLDVLETDDPEARAIYREAIDAGLGLERLGFAAGGGGAGLQRVAELAAEADRRFP